MSYNREKFSYTEVYNLSHLYQIFLSLLNMPARPQQPFCLRGCITQKWLPKRPSDATCLKLKAMAANHQGNPHSLAISGTKTVAAASVPTAVSALMAVTPAIVTPAVAVKTVKLAAGIPHPIC